MRAIVLAAGLGTRLGTLSDELPKPLLPMCDVPLIRYDLALLAAHGFREVAINLHHLGETLVEELDGKCPPLSITWSEEREILGTGGALRKMEDWLTDGGRAPFLVMNGKLVIDVDLPSLIAHHEKTGAVATMVVREVPDPEKWGAIDLDENGRILRVVGKGRQGAAAKRTMFCGVHVLSPKFLARVPDGESHIIDVAYQPALAVGERVESFLYRGYFAEHSTPARYLDGNFALLSGEGKLRHPPAALTGSDETARIASSAKLIAPYRIGAGATVGENAQVGPFAVIGAGATVADGAQVSHSVVWRGAKAEGHLERAIVTRRGAHRLGKEAA
jgi:NDP-sugar pyrophosphorylase family protein